MTTAATSHPVTKRHTSSGLSDRHLRAAELLLAGVRVREVAEELGVARETISRWKRRPDFRALLEQLRQDVQERCGHRLELVSLEALNRTSALVQSPDVRVAFAAIDRVLRHASPVAAAFLPKVDLGPSPLAPRRGEKSEAES